jgi:hypothetical protein
LDEKTSDFLFASEFISTPSASLSNLSEEGQEKGKVSLDQVCSGKIDHLNLKHVSRLESQLHTVLECKFFFILARMFPPWQNCISKLNQITTVLVQVRSSFQTSLLPNVIPELASHLTHLFSQTEKELHSSIQSLLALSVLVPAAPLPSLERLEIHKGVRIPSADEVLSLFPNASSASK